MVTAMIGAARMNDAWSTLPATVKDIVDWLAVTAWLGVLLRLLPHVSTVLTIIWMAIRVYESPTVQGFLAARRKEKSHHDQID